MRCFSCYMFLLFIVNDCYLFSCCVFSRVAVVVEIAACSHRRPVHFPEHFRWLWPQCCGKSGWQAVIKIVDYDLVAMDYCWDYCWLLLIDYCLLLLIDSCWLISSRHYCCFSSMMDCYWLVIPSWLWTIMNPKWLLHLMVNHRSLANMDMY